LVFVSVTVCEEFLEGLSWDKPRYVHEVGVGVGVWDCFHFYC
jgi:hypothetical protein